MKAVINMQVKSETFVKKVKKKMNKVQLKKYYENTQKFSVELRTDIQNFFDGFGGKLAKAGVSANAMSIIGFIIGLLAINFISMQMYATGLLCIIINRMFDGLDGAIARQTKVTNFGVFLDVVLDYIFYGVIIFAFALARPESNAVAASFMLFGFMASACALLAYGVISSKKSADMDVLKKSPVYLGGMAQWSETLAAVVIMCIIPSAFMGLAILFGVISLVKAMTMVAAAYYNFVIADNKKGKNA